MSPFNLRNGLVVDEIRFAAPKTNTSPTATFVAHENAGRTPVLKFTTSSDTDSRGDALSNGYSISALCKTRFSPQQLRDNDIRFMQIVEISEFSVWYAGRKSADGMLGYAFTGNLWQTPLLDCVTRPDLSDAVNRPYYHGQPTDRIGTDFFPVMSDTPGLRVTTDEMNTRTKRWNYLWKFRSKAAFLSYLVFVHKDGSREPLMGWRWELERLIVLRWRGGAPQIYNQMSLLKPEARSTIVAPGFQTHNILVNPGTMAIANIAGNAAQSNFRSSSPDVDFKEVDYYFGDLDENFWV